MATSDRTGWLELYNTAPEPVDIGHWYLSDSAETLRKYQFAGGTIVPADGYLLVDEATQFGVSSADPGALVPFGLNRLGGRLYLTGADVEGRLLGYREDQPYTTAEAGVALGRYTKSTTATDFVRMESPTPGAANDDPTIGPIIINEIMYHPAADESEFIELWNTSDASVPLDHGQGRSWRMRGAIDFAFPVGAVIPAGGFALLLQHSGEGDPAAEAAAFRARHGVSASVPIWTYSAAANGSLSNDGEKLFLEQPVEDLPADAYLIIDAVKYNDQTPWPLPPDGTGPSLGRLDPTLYGNDVASWGVSAGNGTPGRSNVYEDTTPPSRPANLVGRIESTTAVALAWSASTDAESGLDHYRIYRDGQLVGTSVVTRFTDAFSVVSPTPIRYRVSAVNGDGVEGETSVDNVEFGAQTADFQHGVDGYAGTRNAEIREGDPDSSNGLTDTELEVDGDAGGTELSTLIRWDQLSIPANAIVVGASITLDVTNPGDSYAVHQIRRDWDEASVTWNHAATGQLWETAGARGASDRGPQVGTLSGASGTVIVDLNPDGIAMVQSWLADPAGSNFGIAIANPQQSTDGVDLYSHEHPTASQRPRLSILYAPGPTPSKPGDFNLDDVVDDADIDMLVAAIAAGSADPAFNTDRIGNVDDRDFDFLVQEILRVPLGDATLDGIFDSGDMVKAFQAGEYEDGIENNSGWAEGDWNGDGDFDSGDMVKAFQQGLYERPARSVASVGVDASTAIPTGDGDPNHHRMIAMRDRLFAQLAAALACQDDRPAAGLKPRGALAP